MQLRLQWFIYAMILWSLIFGMGFCVKSASADGFLDPKWAADWDWADKILLSGYTSTWFIDFGQTRTIAKNPDKYYELNKHLGRHPSVETVNTYFLACYVGNVFLANNLGEVPEWKGVDWGSVLRKAWLAYWMAEHYRCAKHNEDIGIAIDFTLVRF